MAYSVAFNVGTKLRYFKLMVTTVSFAGKIIHIPSFRTTNSLTLKKSLAIATLFLFLA
jgi:hypothetical protein